MRKISFTGFENGQPVNYHWTQVFEKYQKELDDLTQKVHDLESGKSNP